MKLNALTMSIFLTSLLFVQSSQLLQSSHDRIHRHILHSIKEWSINFQNGTKISLSHSSQRGVYIVGIEFMNRLCNTAETNLPYLNLAKSNITTNLIYERYGPDEMVIYIEGKELHAQLAKYTGCNHYQAAFEINHHGLYHMKIIHTRGGYTAVNEFIDAFPTIAYNELASEWLELNGTTTNINHNSQQQHMTASEECSSYMNKASAIASGHWVEIGDNSNSIFDVHRPTAEALPKPIKYTAPSDDRRLNITSYVPISTSHGNKGCFDSIDKYKWEFSQSAIDQELFQHQKCTDNREGSINNTAISRLIKNRYKQYTPQEAAMILSNKILQFNGDSHMRMVTQYLLKWACDPDGNNGRQYNNLKKNTHSVIHFASDSSACPNLRINYRANLFCSDLPETSVKYDFVLFNCGHHYASHFHETFEQYRSIIDKTIRDYSDRIRWHGYSRHNVVWMESVPQPIRSDHWVMESKDWRTIQRLSMYNDYANTMFRHHNYTVIETFHALLPLGEGGCDFAHYTHETMLYPIFQQILSFLENK